MAIFSRNRFETATFYHLIDYLTLDPETAWYRTRLLEVAISNISEYWLLGSWIQLAPPLGRANRYQTSCRCRETISLIVALRGGLLALFGIRRSPTSSPSFSATKAWANFAILKDTGAILGSSWLGLIVLDFAILLSRAVLVRPLLLSFHAFWACSFPLLCPGANGMAHDRAQKLNSASASAIGRFL